MKKLLLLAIISFIAFQSCKKDPQPIPPPESTKPFEGTWYFNKVVYELCRFKNKKLNCKKIAEVPGSYNGVYTTAEGTMVIKRKDIFFKSTVTFHYKKPEDHILEWECAYTHFKKNNQLYIRCKNKEYDKLFLVRLSKMKMSIVEDMKHNQKVLRTTLTLLR